MSDEKKEITLQDIGHRLSALETIVVSLMAERNKGTHGDDEKSKAPISFESIGGVKVGHPIPVKGPVEISFEEIGGIVVKRSPLWAESEHEDFAASK